MKWRSTLSVYATSAILAGSLAAEEADPAFESEDDALAVRAEDDGTNSLRVAEPRHRPTPCTIIVSLERRTTAFPSCRFLARVLTPANPKCRQTARRLRAGSRYRFAPKINVRRQRIDTRDSATLRNLGVCYYPAGVKLALQLGTIDYKAKRIKVAGLDLLQPPPTPTPL